MDEEMVRCEMSETCMTKRCKHRLPHEYDEDECDDHFCDKHMKNFDCIEEDE